MLSYLSNLIGRFLPNNSVSIQSVPGKYLVNDPTTPTLVEDQVIPPTCQLVFNVHGLKNTSEDIKQQALNCQITVGRCLNYFEQMYRKFGRLPKNWAKTHSLSVQPRAKQGLNAFYNQYALVFYYDTQKNIYTADSADIVCHELGHALLDALRPDFWSIQSAEIWAFHEAFADITAIVGIMQSDVALEYALKETDGDLMKSNVLSKIAEEIGTVMANRNWLRDATVRFNYVNPKHLPKEAPEDELSLNPHSLGRVFTGAWYEMMVKIYTEEKKIYSPIEALKRARDTAYLYLLKATKNSPAHIDFFEILAKNILMADQMNGSIYKRLIERIFESRKIIRPRIKLLFSTSWKDMIFDLGKNDVVVKKKEITTVTRKRSKTVKLSDYYVTTLSTTFLTFDLELELAVEDFYVFNQDGVLIEEYVSDEEEAIQHCLLCTDFIEKEGLGLDKTWTSQNNKLVRNFIS